MGRRSVLARFPARLPELFCHHRVCVQARCKGIGGGSGIASSSPGPSAPPRTRRRRRARRIVAEPSPATRASSLPPRARGRSASRPPLARPTHAREIRFTNNDNGSAGARVAEPGRDALRQPRTARLSLSEPNFARLTALAVPLRQNRLFGSLEQGEKRINARSNSPTREGDCIGGSEFFASFA